MIRTKNRDEFLETISHYIPKDSKCIELGVYNGEFSRKMLNILKPSKLYLVDPWLSGSDKNGKNETYGNTLGGMKTAYSGEGEYQQVIQGFSNEINIEQVIVDRNFSYDAVKNYPDDFFDLIYIDSCHLYDCVKSDLSDYLCKLKKEGIMAGHDYSRFDDFGVIEAVDEFVIKNNFELFILNEEHNDWALKRSKA
jgi:hypothetical protein